MARRRGAQEGACTGGATTPQPSILRLILNAAALATASPTLLQEPKVDVAQEGYPTIPISPRGCSPWHLCKHPRLRRKIVNTRADLRVLSCLWQALRRTNVEFHALKTIRKQIASMELSLYGDTRGENEDDVGEWELDEVPTFVHVPRAPHSPSVMEGG